MSNQSNQSYSTTLDTSSALASIAQNALSLQVATICGFLWGGAWLGFSILEPQWYKKANINRTNRNHVVGLVLGLVFKLITIPSCALAAYMTPPAHDVAGALAPMNVYQQVCWGSRGSTVIFELYHFSANMELVMHHGLIIVAMAFIAIFNCSHRGIDLSLGALVSEFPSMAFSFLSRLGWAGKNPERDWKLLVAGAVLTLVVRVPSVFLTMAMVPESGMRGGPGSVVFLAYLIYLGYNLNISLRRLKKAKVFQSWETSDRSWDFGIRCSPDFTIGSTAFSAGLAVLTVQMLGLAYYSTCESATRGRLILAGFGSIVPLLVVLEVAEFEGRFERFVKTIMFWIASAKWVDLGTFTRWSVAGWIAWIAILASLGETPNAHNKNTDPMDIVASSPLFCSLVQSWAFWVSSTIALVFPMIFVQMEVDQQKDTEQWRQEADKAREAARIAKTEVKHFREIDVKHVPEIHVQSIKEEDEDVWTPEAQLLKR